MKWLISSFVLFLPLYLFRFPFYVAGVNAEIPFLEIAVYVIAAIVFARDIKGSLNSIKDFFSGNKILLIGLALLWAGLIGGVFQSNSAFVSLGIVRGWFFAPFVWFLALVVIQNKESINSLFALVFAFSAGTVAAISLLFPHFNQDARMAGFYGSPNYLAMYIVPLLPFVAYQSYRAYRKFFAPRTFTESLKKHGWLFVLGLCLITVFFSFSFGAWLGLAVATITLISWLALRSYRNPFLITASFFALAAVVAFAVFHTRIIEKIYSRLGIWQAAWNMGISHPIFGIGEGMFQTAYQLQKHIIPHPVPLESALHPHNIFLTFWLYAGIFGLAGFLCILIWISKKIYGKLKKNPRDFFTVAIACSFIIILTHGLVDTTYWKNDLAFMWWTLIGLLV